jgi:carbon starvation protein CstA
MSSILEATMLVCFGLSWPINTMKAYRARSAKNMSLPFILMIITGYLAGISAKLLTHQTNYVLAVYFVNLVVVSLNLMVYFRNKKLDMEGKEAVA